MTFPTVLDSTALNSYRSCPRQFWWSQIRALRPRGGSIHLHAGAAFARGLEVARRSSYLLNNPPEIAVQAGLTALWDAYGSVEASDQQKTVDRMSGLLEAYFDHFPLDRDEIQPARIAGAPAIEFSFAIPLPINHPVSGDPLLIAGRCDMIASFQEAAYTLDDKTCKQLGASWASQWDLRAQFDTYNWAAREYGLRTAGTIIRGCCIRASQHDYDFTQVVTMCPEWRLERWYTNTLLTIRHMIDDWHNGEWLYNFGETCNAFGGCPFRRMCERREPEPWIDIEMEHNDWNPLERGV